MRYKPEQLYCKYCRFLASCLREKKIIDKEDEACEKFDRTPGSDDDIGEIE